MRLGDWIVIGIVVIVVALIVVRLWRNRKRGGCACSGCSGCSGCTGGCGCCKEKEE